MSTKQHIDKLLKDNLGQLEQTPPPDAWSSIQQGLSNIPSTGAEVGAKSIATGVKSVSILTKVIVAVASSAVIAGAYITYTYSEKDQKEDVAIAYTPQPDPIPAQDQQSVTEHQNGNTVSVESDVTLEQPLSSKEEQLARLTVNKGTEISSQEKMPSTASDNMNTTETGQNTEGIAALPGSITDKPQISSNPIVKNNPEPKQGIQQVPPKPKPKHSFDDQEKDKQSGSSDDYVIEPKPIIPNTFTPNDDGENDRFKIVIEDEIVYELTIYDKDDKKVFESTSKEKTWDGSYNNLGVPCDGMVYYIFIYQYEKGKPHTMRGTITLLRKN